MQEADRFEDFVGLIAAIDKEIQRIKTAELARFGLRASDLMVTYHLERNPEGLSCAELARRAEVDRAAITRTVNRLTEGGFVEVGTSGDGAARYRAPVTLTAKGRNAMEQVNGIIKGVVDRAGGQLSDRARASLYKSLASVLDQLKDISR